MKFKKVRLGEIANFSQGKQVSINEQFEKKTKNMKRFVRIVDYTNVDEPMRYVKDYGDRYYATEEEVVMIRYGSQTAGMVAMGKDGIIANNLFKINLNNNIVLNKYLFYYLSQKKIFNYLRNSQSSSTMPAINFSILNSMELSIPTIENQNKVISILNSINKKIELNNQINDNLLEIINCLYKETFNDIQVYDKAENIANITIGKTPPRNEKECFTTNANDMKWVSISDLGKSGTYIFNTSERLTMESVDKYNVKIIPRDTIILSFKLTIGRIAITTENMATNEAIAHFNLNNDDMKYYLYSYLKNFDYARLGSTSSIATAVNSKIIKAMPIGIPDEKVLKEYNEKVESMFEKVLENEKENQTLEQLRDTVLPKLMNGEIDLENIEI